MARVRKYESRGRPLSGNRQESVRWWNSKAGMEKARRLAIAKNTDLTNLLRDLVDAECTRLGLVEEATEENRQEV